MTIGTIIKKVKKSSFFDPPKKVVCDPPLCKNPVPAKVRPIHGGFLWIFGQFSGPRKRGVFGPPKWTPKTPISETHSVGGSWKWPPKLKFYWCIEWTFYDHSNHCMHCNSCWCINHCMQRRVCYLAVDHCKQWLDHHSMIPMIASLSDVMVTPMIIANGRTYRYVGYRWNHQSAAFHEFDTYTFRCVRWCKRCLRWIIGNHGMNHSNAMIESHHETPWCR